MLAALAEFGPASRAALSDRASVYKSDLRRLGSPCPDPADKRRNVITITELGESRLAELDRVLDGVNNHIMPRSTRMNARSCLFC